MRYAFSRIPVLLVALCTMLVFPALASGDSLGLITFESSQGYILGNIHNQPITNNLPNGKWSKLGPYDVQVVSVSSFPAAATYGFGSQALRLSNAVTSGSFGDQTFSPGLGDEAGESGASNAGLSGGVRQPHFDASFLIGTTQVAAQAGLRITVSPDRGDGARMSFLAFADQADGVHVTFSDVVNKGPVGAESDFRSSEIAVLSRDRSHLIQFSIDLKDGAANDTVKIYIDSRLVKTGSTWEDYYRYDSEQTPQGNQVPTIDKLLFRMSSDPAATTLGNGFLVDRVTLDSSGFNFRK